MASNDPQPATPPLIRDLLWNFAISQAVFVAAKLAIFDTLDDGAKTAAEIAAQVDADEAALYRLLRALTTVNLLVEENRRFTATPAGAQLSSKHETSWRPVALHLGLPAMWQSWGDMEETIRTGQPAFNRVNGASFFEHFTKNPADGAVFNAAMTSLSNVDMRAILGAYDFSECATIVDIGGGNGALLRGILERNPGAHGVLFDLPPVVEKAPALRGSPVAGRCEFIGGSMFQSVPAGGNLYILKHILHDWNDDECVQILRNCRQSIAPHGKILHIGELIRPSNQPDFAKWLDLNMLVQLTGRERTEAEFQELYAKAGFRLTRVIATRGPAIVEGVPV